MDNTTPQAKRRSPSGTPQNCPAFILAVDFGVNGYVVTANAASQTRRAKRVRDETMTPKRRCLQSACSARVSFLESNLISGNPLFSRQAVIIIVHHLCNDPPACLPLRSSGLCGSQPQRELVEGIRSAESC